MVLPASTSSGPDPGRDTAILPPDSPFPTKSLACPSRRNVTPLIRNAPKLCPALPENLASISPSLRAMPRLCISPDSMAPTERSVLPMSYETETSFPTLAGPRTSVMILLSSTSPIISGCPSLNILVPSATQSSGEMSILDAFPVTFLGTIRSALPTMSARLLNPMDERCLLTSSATDVR